MHIVLAALFGFAISTMWIPAAWPVAVFQTGVFALTPYAVCRTPWPPIPRLWPAVPLGFAVVWGVLQWISGRACYAYAAKTATVQWATLLSVLLVGACAWQQPSRLKWFRKFMIWCGAALSVVGVLQRLTSGGRIFWLFPVKDPEFVLGPFLSRNEYAAFVEVILPMALVKAFAAKRHAAAYAVVAAWMYASVVASASRAGTLLATAEILVVVAALWTRGRLRGRAAAAAVAGIAALCTILVLVVGPETVLSRFQLADPLVLRREFAMASVRMIARHPWLGVGLGAWPVVYPNYAVADFGLFANQAHSDWLQWTAEGGLPLGLVLGSLMFWSVRRAAHAVWGIGVVAVMLHACVDYPFARPAMGSWTVVAMSMLAEGREAQYGRHSKAPGS